MLRFRGLFRILGLLAVVLWMGLPTAQTASLPSTGLVGAVKSSDGEPLEGVAISARAQDKTFTTSVYTNQDGEYFFPSSLADGSYRIWAQAVGFQIARSERTISSEKKIEQNFILKPFQDFYKQLSGTEWTNSLPADTPEDRRMQRILHNNCTTCHVAGFVLAKRFDATGWGIIMDTMINKFTRPDAPNRLLFEAYKEDLVEYLTRVRGPEPYPLKFKPSPRATGEATQIVVTEYDVPRGDTPDEYFMTINGSDWSEGIPGRYEGVVMHDAVVGKDGNVYFSDNSTPERTVGQLDPKTGRVTGYKLADKDGFAVRTHGVAVDPQGKIWLTNGTEGTMVRFDPQTEKFQRFPKPNSMTQGIGGMIMADSKGNMWTTHARTGFDVEDPYIHGV